MEIKINKDTPIDLEKLVDSKLLIQANSGGGKSWAVRRVIEQAFGKTQIIVLDTEGEFSNLREKNDFVLVGKGADAPAEVRSAELLAKRLLELKVSAIIDLYELLPKDRKHFVKLFLNALINAPKDLWPINHGDCLVILDEAHIYAPEKGESEALDAVASMASLGRKRGLGLILATQRISKLNKDAAAECNNKLIGRASLDIDRKRAADELGFTTKEQVLSLRDLEPGEFYTFGPAISREVTKLVIGDVHAKPPGRGSARKATPEPTEKVRKILAKLADLPQEAKKEADTIQSLKAEVRALKTHRCPTGSSEKDIKRAVDAALSQEARKYQSLNKAKDKAYSDMIALFSRIKKMIPDEFPTLYHPPENLKTSTLTPKNIEKVYRALAQQIPIDNQPTHLVIEDDRDEMGLGEKKVLTAIAQHEEGISREHITVITSYKRSTRDAYIQRLVKRFFVRVSGDKIIAEPYGIQELGPDFTPLPTGQDLRAYLLSNLPDGEKKILSHLIDSYPEALSRDRLTELTNYQRSTRDAYIQRLGTRNLLESTSEGVKAADKLFD